jgi:hypothetical protein
LVWHPKSAVPNSPSGLTEGLDLCLALLSGACWALYCLFRLKWTGEAGIVPLALGNLVWDEGSHLQSVT